MILIDDYVKFHPRGKTQEAKLVDIRNNLVKLDDDLKSVDCQKELETNSWIHQKVFKDLPLYWQNKFSEDEDEYIRKEGNRWKALFKLIKDEAFRIETKLAHRLDPKINDSSHDSSSKSILDFSKLPKKLQKQVNAALTKYDGGGKSPGVQDSSSKSSFNSTGKRTVKKSARFNEFAAKIGKCPECDEIHSYVSRARREEFVSGSLLACDTFKKYDINKKAATVAKHKACAICLSWSHQRDSCHRPRE